VGRKRLRADAICRHFESDGHDFVLDIIVKPGYNDSALMSGANVTPPDKSHL
jgi:hypothetical protein